MIPSRDGGDSMRPSGKAEGLRVRGISIQPSD
jgi:hypothetical protein